MAIARPAADDVIALTSTSLDMSVVDQVITDAALIAEKCVRNLPAVTQRSAIKWLAAHLIASTHDGGVMTSSKLGDASEAYSRAVVGNGLMGTTYGQQAVALVPCLGRIGRPRASITVV